MIWNFIKMLDPKIFFLVLILVVVGGAATWQELKLIKSEKTNIELQMSNNEMVVEIKLLKASLQELNTTYINQQIKLSEVSKKNSALSKQTKELIDQLNNRPIPKTCEESLSELSGINDKMAKEWNK